IEDATIDEVSVRIYSPLNLSQDKNKYLPAISFYHRGAFYMGSVETHHPITRRLAIQTGFIVISVEYRLASEHPFPAGVDDWDSAGGNLAAVIAMQLANNANSVNVPRIQVLIYLVVQFFDFMLPSYLTSILNIFDFGRASAALEYYLNKTITNDVLINNHTSIEQKKKYHQFVDWSLILNKYQQIYKEPITDNINDDPKVIENTKQYYFQIYHHY
ncbi:unnamed protein product, partial [Rotaria sp. Silwood2]